MGRRAIQAAILASLLASGSAFAQGLEAEGAIDAIVGSEIKEQESSAQNDNTKIVDAIDTARENAAAVRKMTAVSEVEIVFLSDAATTEGGPPADIQGKLDEREEDVKALRKEIEGNALLYHAINSRQVMMRDVLAIEIGDGNRIVVYAAAKPGG